MKDLLHKFLSDTEMVFRGKMKSVNDFLGRQKYEDFLDGTIIGGLTLREILVKDPDFSEQFRRAVEESMPGRFESNADIAAWLKEKLEQGEQSFQGSLNLIKGKLYEIKVVDSLNNDAKFIESGFKAELASDPTQKGHDLEIYKDGKLFKKVQLKATDRAEYVAEAKEKYPDIEIQATAEVQQPHESPFRDAQMEAGTREEIVNISDAGLEDQVSDSAGEAVAEMYGIPLDFLEEIPLTTVTIYSIINTYKVLTGKTSRLDAVKDVSKKGLKSALAASATRGTTSAIWEIVEIGGIEAVEAELAGIVAGPLGIAAAIVTIAMLGSAERRAKYSEFVEAGNEELQKLTKLLATV